MVPMLDRMEFAACTETTEHVAIELTLEPESASQARNAISRLRPHAEAASFDDVRLLVSELIVDALATEPRSPHAVVTVEAEVLDGATWVMVAFEGLALRVPADKPEPAELGWGTYLVRTLATRWGLKRANGSTYVWFQA
jgi:hypothetical protein